jgi:D-glycero-D-manno-heptose 1,7-bisphosphate phosphatase
VRPALLLDRDGTIIVDHGYLSDPARVALVPGAADVLKAFQDAGWLLVVISNQSGIARGMFGRAELDAVHARMVEVLANEGIHLDAAYYCAHAPEDGCACRKPRPGLIEQAARELDIDLRASLMVGDKPSDVDAGVAAGCSGVLFREDWTPVLESLHPARRC